MLATALAAYGVFHFLPATKSDPEENGWKLWVELWDVIRNPESLGEPLTAVGVSSFLTFSVLIAAAPFLGIIWRKSRIAWWMAVIFSGLAAGGFWFMVLVNHSPDEELLAGAWSLMAAPVLNCAGLLLARAGIPESSDS